MKHKPRPLIDLLVSIVLPSVILMRFSGDEHLGAVGALVLALAFPISLGLYELIRYRVKNFIALLGLISVLLTGGIGLLQLDTEWLAVDPRISATAVPRRQVVLLSAARGFQRAQVDIGAAVD